MCRRGRGAVRHVGLPVANKPQGHVLRRFDLFLAVRHDRSPCSSSTKVSARCRSAPGAAAGRRLRRCPCFNLLNSETRRLRFLSVYLVLCAGECWEKKTIMTMNREHSQVGHYARMSRKVMIATKSHPAVNMRPDHACQSAPSPVCRRRNAAARKTREGASMQGIIVNMRRSRVRAQLPEPIVTFSSVCDRTRCLRYFRKATIAWPKPA